MCPVYRTMFDFTVVDHIPMVAIVIQSLGYNHERP